MSNNNQQPASTDDILEAELQAIHAQIGLPPISVSEWQARQLHLDNEAQFCIASLQNTIAELEESCEEKDQKTEDLDASCKQKEAELGVLTDCALNQSIEVGKLESWNNEAQFTITSLQDRIVQLEKSIGEKDSKVAKQDTSCKKKDDELNCLMHYGSQLADEVEMLGARNKKMQSENKRLESRYVKDYEEIKKLGEYNWELEMEIGALKNSLEKKAEQVTRLNISMKQKDGELTKSHSRIFGWENEVAKLRFIAAKRASQVKQLNISVEQKDDELIELQSRIFGLENDVAKLEFTTAKKAEKISSFKFANATLGMKMRELQVSENIRRDDQKSKVKYIQALETANKRNEDKIKGFQLLRSKMAKMIVRLTASETDLQASNANQEVAIGELIDALLRKDKTEKGYVSVRKSKVNDLQRSIASKDRMIVVLKKPLRAQNKPSMSPSHDEVEDFIHLEHSTEDAESSDGFELVTTPENSDDEEGKEEGFSYFVTPPSPPKADEQQAPTPRRLCNSPDVPMTPSSEVPKEKLERYWVSLEEIRAVAKELKCPEKPNQANNAYDKAREKCFDTLRKKRKAYAEAKEAYEWAIGADERKAAFKKIMEAYDWCVDFIDYVRFAEDCRTYYKI